MTFRILVMQDLLRLQKDKKLSLKYLVYHLLILKKSSISNFGTAITNADVIHAVKTSTLGTLNTDFNLQCREDTCLHRAHTDTSLNRSYDSGKSKKILCFV